MGQIRSRIARYCQYCRVFAVGLEVKNAQKEVSQLEHDIDQANGSLDRVKESISTESNDRGTLQEKARSLRSRLAEINKAEDWLVI